MLFQNYTVEMRNLPNSGIAIKIRIWSGLDRSSGRRIQPHARTWLEPEGLQCLLLWLQWNDPGLDIEMLQASDSHQ